LQDLIKNGRAFARLVEEFGSQETPLEETETLETLEEATDPKAKLKSTTDRAALMQKEERNTGQVENITYAKYLRAAGGLSWAPLLVLLLTLAQAAQGMYILAE
jgi:ATP-binding cassette subfamily C (CFTR/MRP) protein 1